jgi:uncharacterized protein (TIGR03435 family)
MEISRREFRSRKNQLISAIGLAAFALLIVLGPAIASPAHARSQVQGAAATLPVYEVAAIKLTPSGNTVPGTAKESDDGFIAANAPLRSLMRWAYGVQDFQISGAGPDWVGSEKYEIDAKMGASGVDWLQKLTPDQRVIERRRMLQTLLADRFKLTIHRETKDIPVFMLVIAKNGPKLPLSKPGGTFRGIGVPPASAAGGPRWARGQTVSMANLAIRLSGILGRTVVDKTGLTGAYDISLEWTEDTQAGGAPGGAPTSQPSAAALDPISPSIFTAIQEQLGLKLESGKGPVEVIMIDHAERPSGN